MFKISLDQASKEFYRQWIFRDLSLELVQGSAYALTGPNGSGKSTLTAVLMGHTLPSKGKVTYSFGEKELDYDQWHRHITLAAPYLELIEEFTLMELLQFHFKFKKPVEGLKPKDLVEIMYLEDARNKAIRFYSSGMKQRLKLGLAFFSQSEAIFLDEPTSNLDDRARQWYQDQLDKVLADRLVVIASNVPEEYKKCQQIVSLQ